MSKVFLVTGAGRGMGVDIAKAALDAGHSVVATARNLDTVSTVLGTHERLLPVRLDVTSPADTAEAVCRAVEHFGRIDVLINNAGNFYGGFFEELSPEQVRSQIETNLFGPMNVSRQVLPVMRRQQSGLVVSISSLAGLVGGEFTSAYAASKFGLEGWMESLTPEVEPFGIRTMIVEPGYFRTELLEPTSTTFAELSLDDYAQRTDQIIPAWQAMNGQQPGDPKKLAQALMHLVDSGNPPLRWVAGADAVLAAEQKAQTLLLQVEAQRALSTSLGHENV
ncbi:MAG TPA: SDR family NAD(P)-dependent oxidoreductase [Allosphingosinicella sp.]|jgi:NAD(P)-dependent dehydrogenase (short-subunit alcohol dehydrogenase family)